METPIIVQSDPKDYPFKKFCDEQKHLDCDEHRHKIKPICHVVVQDFKGEEHVFCDKSQRNAEGKFRRPKKLMEAEQRGFKSVAEMVEADKKAEEDKKVKETEDLKKQNSDLQKQLDDYKALTEERFNKLVNMMTQK
jgi:hypothetical protein